MVADIYNYVITNITYDTAKAASVQSGYLPNVEWCWPRKRESVLTMRPDDGHAALPGHSHQAGGWLHREPVPRLDQRVSGRSGWVDNVIYFDGNAWKLMDPTFASNGKRSAAIMDYIGNGSNYRTRFSY